jgi:hypothetical protein
MSEAIENTETAPAEDRFFGVRTKIEKGAKAPVESNEEQQIELEIVDDRAEEDQRPAKAKAPEDEPDDDELSGYSEKVQKRINKLKYEQHEERRQREAAEKVRDEAVAVTQQLHTRNQEMESVISRGESALVAQIKAKAALALQSAKDSYKKAYEEGDTDNVVSSQEALYKAQAEMAEAEKYERNLAVQAAKPQVQQPAPQQQPPPPPQVDPEAKEWAEKNSWFMDPAHRRMTATAYGLHEEAVLDRKIKPNTPDYFEFIDSGMREAYPKFGWQDSDSDGLTATSTASQTSTVVAPSNRNNGAKPRKLKLKPSQVSLAKKLGITNEQYAKEFYKESLR